MVTGNAFDALPANYIAPAAVSIQIGGDGTSVKIVAILIMPLQIATAASLPDATQNIFYTNNLAARGGQPPYSWSLATGAILPAGLMLSASGAIYGTPASSGETTFPLVVTDATNGSATQTFKLIVTPPEAPVFGAVKVTITGSASGGWQLDGGAFQKSGVTLSCSS